LTKVAAVDEHIRAIAAEALTKKDANDVIREFEASQDYDPAPALLEQTDASRGDRL